MRSVPRRRRAARSRCVDATAAEPLASETVPRWTAAGGDGGSTRASTMFYCCYCHYCTRVSRTLEKQDAIEKFSRRPARRSVENICARLTRRRASHSPPYRHRNDRGIRPTRKSHGRVTVGRTVHSRCDRCCTVVRVVGVDRRLSAYSIP